MRAPALLRGISAFAVGVPALTAVVSFVVPYVVPDCSPQMYGVGECLLAGVNLAPGILVAAFAGLYLAAGALVFVAGPLLLLARWLELRDASDAV